MHKTMLMGAAAMLALLTGCQSEPTANVAVANEAANLVDPEPAAANTAAAAEVSETAALALNLASDELTLVTESGSARHIPFGMERATALHMISAALGSPIEQDSNQDCGGGKLDYAAFRQGLSLYFQDGKFAGWNLDGRENGKFTTANGIGIGMTRAALEDSGSEVTVEESTIGLEFMTGDMSGLLSAPGPGGKVTNLWAGVNCIAR
ncbi:hypothetical protein [Sphingomonas soli]|uniref:hypothetical protein n=1 Tax=Sphingomonas soli TaxID=266127 RepID=UPI0008298D28|nr:hypothetical protein [Sphingomonas soli]